MGLCKCPKRKVTNQFCFEHRVNVCEYCIVQKHPKCVVKSYLQWLEDSDYNPVCELCNHGLADESCARLICYHVFHWNCLDHYGRGFPADTAPAGFTCPAANCSEGIFPRDNLVSPVADALRDALKGSHWARAGLGLPLLEGDPPPPMSPHPPAGPRPTPEGQTANNGLSSLGMSEGPAAAVHHHNAAKTAHDFDQDVGTMSRGGKGYSSLNFSDASLTTSLLQDPDAEDNKYKRKSALEMLLRWWKSTLGPASRRRGSRTQRYAMTIVLVVVGFVSFVVLMSYLARGSNYEDPMLEPLNNPNIRIAQDSA